MPKSQETHIAGLAVKVRPEAMDATIEAARKLKGVDVMAFDPKGKIVVVVEAATTGRVADVVDDLRHRDGVYAVDMVYHEIDDGSETDTANHVA